MLAPANSGRSDINVAIIKERLHEAHNQDSSIFGRHLGLHPRLYSRRNRGYF